MSRRPTVVVTGAAGFIGFHVSRALLSRGYAILGLDNLNDYYDVTLKQSRLEILREHPSFDFLRIDIADRSLLRHFLRYRTGNTLIHLAAQAGVRYSLENPAAYVDSNLVGFGNVLEACRENGVSHLIYASSSSVYGMNSEVPFSESHRADHPVSLYAATKRANELMAHAYSHLFGFTTTGLRFFTVYGPWGRPDMAPFLFTKAIFDGKPISVFNGGAMERDFTYVADVAESVGRLLEAGPATGTAPHRIYNVGNHQPVPLMRFLDLLQTAIGRKAKLESKPMQPGDVVSTYADTELLYQAIGYRPSTPLEKGLRAFVDWYREHYHSTRALSRLSAAKPH